MPRRVLDNRHAPQPATRVDETLEETGFEVERPRTNDTEPLVPRHLMAAA